MCEAILRTLHTFWRPILIVLHVLILVTVTALHGVLVMTILVCVILHGGWDILGTLATEDALQDVQASLERRARGRRLN